MPFQNPPKICPVCQKGNEFKFIQDYQNKDGKFSLYECNYCKVQFWQPFKSLNSYQYNKEYIGGRMKKPKLKNWHKRFLQLYKNLLNRMKILDIGCGTGEFLFELQKRGYEVWGVDFSKNAIETAQKYFALKNVYTMSFNEFFKKKDLPQFDIITFFEIIEHLDNPLEFIQNVKRLLKPNGKIILSTPWRERLLPSLNIWDYPSFHLTRWNEKAISNFFQKINFEISHIDYFDVNFSFFYQIVISKSRTGLMGKIKNFSRSRPKSKIFIKIINFLIYLRDFINFIIGGIFGGFLWISIKIIKAIKCGKSIYSKEEMLIELKLK